MQQIVSYIGYLQKNGGIMSRIFTLSLFWIVFATCLSSCKTDVQQDAQVTVDQIEGEWSIVQVLRNGKVTTSLESGFLVFHDDNTVESNILSGDNRHTFTYEARKISIQGDENLKSLEVGSLSGDTMVLSSKVASFDMLFTLIKKK